MFILKQAKLSWRDNVPFSSEFNDVYFSSRGGLEETENVFLAGNGLPERWQDVASFTIAETGFGTGLNFLVTLQQWAISAPSDATLSFISVEKNPLAVDDLERALTEWPQLKSCSDELVMLYPEAVAGFHRRSFLEGRVVLTLIFDDVGRAFEALESSIVDAWYLDGFAPSRNPKMWDGALFDLIAKLSKPQATFSTYTAAGAVRRGLQAAGFTVEKKAGFGGKRERLQGCILQSESYENKAPWFHIGNKDIDKSSVDEKKVDEKKVDKNKAIVIGGGISGGAMAYSLLKRGWQVTVLERNEHLASGASGNLAGVVMPRLSSDMDLASQFYMSAFLYTVHWLDQLKRVAVASLPWFKSGVLSLLDNRKAEKLNAWGFPASVLQKVTQGEASVLCGAPLTQGGLYYPGAGYLDPVALINYLMESQRNLKVDCGVNVVSLQRVSGQWLISTESGRKYSAATVVLANGFDATHLLGADYLHLSKVRGQLTYLPERALIDPITKPVCSEGYIIPAYKSRYCIGATYGVGDMNSQISHLDHETNLASIAPVLSRDVPPSLINEGRVAWRATTRDYLPVIGPALDRAFYTSQYKDIKHGRSTQYFPSAGYKPGLWLLVGMGSRGLVSAPYGAELLADLIEGKPRCLSSKIMHALHPGRHLIRQLRQGSFK